MVYRHTIDATSYVFDDLRDLYQEVILDHSRRPRHAVRMENFDSTAKGDNPISEHERELARALGRRLADVARRLADNA